MLVSLRSLSDSEILARAHTLATRERKLTLLLILHLNEIEQRRLYLEQGYSSMFDYCTSALCYSEPAAVRRIRVARCVARFPRVLALLQANEVNISTISRVARALTPANQHVLLAQVRGRSQREVDAIVAAYFPRTAPRDVVRTVVVRLPAAPFALAPNAPLPLTIDTDARGASSNTRDPALRVDESMGARDGLTHPAARSDEATIPDAVSSETAAASPEAACEKDAYRRSDGDFDPVPDQRAAETIATERRVHFHFAASEAFKAKLEKTRSLAWHRLPAHPSLEQIFELTLEFFIEKHDPAARLQRRAQRRDRTRAVTSPSQPSPARRGSRYIAASIRDEVFMRDGGRCTFVGASGRRCQSRNGLQIDHVKPVAHGGPSTIDNLRLLCAYHNRLEAERLMGPPVRRKSRRQPEKEA